MGEIIIKESKWKTVRLTLLSFIMVLASAFNLVVGIINGGMLYIVVGIIGTVFFGYAFVYILIRTIKTLKGDNDHFLIRINDEGITDNSSKAGLGLIRWEEIKSAKTTRVFSQKFVTLNLQDEEGFFSKLPKKMQTLRKINQVMKFKPINLSVQTAKMTTEELQEIIENRLESYKS